MNSKAIIPLAIGLAVGLLAVKLGVDVIQRAKASGSSTAMVNVVVAAKDIPDTAKIQPDMVKYVRTPKALAPAQCFSVLDDVIGRVTNRSIPQGLPVVASMLAPPGTPEGIEVRLKPGYRAMAIKVDEYTMVGGHLRPGCRVDVCAVWNVRGRNRNETVSRVILQNVEVLAVGAAVAKSGETGTAGARSVTLMVKHEDAPKLTFADTKAKIRLALRSPGDAIAKPPSVTTESELLGGIARKDGESAADRKSTTKPKAGGWLARIFGLTKPATSPIEVGPTPKPAAVARPVKLTVAAAPHEPYVVELIRGQDKQTIYFASESALRPMSLDAKNEPWSRKGTSGLRSRYAGSGAALSGGTGSACDGARTDASAPETQDTEDGE